MFGVTLVRFRSLCQPVHLLLLAALILLPSAESMAGGGEAKPYSVAVRVAYGSPDGPDTLREEIELSLTLALASAGCFEKVLPHAGDGPPDADLLFEVSLDQYRAETEYFTSKAVIDSPRSSPDERNRVRVAFISLVRFEISTVGTASRVRNKRYMQNEHYIPMMQEDPHYAARRLLVDGVTSKGRTFACKGSAKKLAREIAEAKPLR